MQRGRVGYTTLTICQPLYKTSRKSFHCVEVGENKPDMNKQFLSTLLYFFWGGGIFCHNRVCMRSTGLVLKPQ